MNLVEYVLAHTERGECHCGYCIDRGDRPDPEGHTIDVGFFKVAKRGDPDAKMLQQLTDAWAPVFQACNPLDGNPHSFIEIGAWIGDQGIGMQFMALAEMLDLAGVARFPSGPVLLPKVLANIINAKE